MHCKVAIITLDPVYCKTERYKPVLINNGIAINGIAIKSHQLLNIDLWKIPSGCRKKASHIDKFSIITSNDNVIICL